MKDYRAPWGTSLILISTVGALVCIGVAVGVTLDSRGTVSVFALTPLIVLFACALFTIRGYTVTSEALLIRRLFWTTRVPLSELRSARFQPKIMGWGVRTSGIGGLFSFSGSFSNKALGAYRAFVTDPQRTVVLHFPASTVVISPSTPEKFVHDIGATIHANA